MKIMERMIRQNE
jgi:dynein intermediate chain 1